METICKVTKCNKDSEYSRQEVLDLIEVNDYRLKGWWVDQDKAEKEAKGSTSEYYLFVKVSS